MAAEPVTFDLTSQPWLPVLRDGRTADVSLTDALVDAHDIDGLAPELPTMLPVLLRHVLLPVIIDSHGLPTSTDAWATMRNRGSFETATVRAYLDKYADRFDLFDPERPFAQVADLATSKGDTAPSQQLVPTVAGGNNVPLFTRQIGDSGLPLTPAEAARWLLHTHSWDTAGIKSGAVGDPTVQGGRGYGSPVAPLGHLGPVVPAGSTLFDTIMLNIPVAPDGLAANDAPWWRRDPPEVTWEERPAAGLLDLLTWQTRRIRLHPTITGDGEVQVRRSVVAGGDRLAVRPDYEPHTGWRVNNDGELVPVKHHPDRAVWAGLDALTALPETQDDGPSDAASPLLLQIGRLAAQRHLPDDYPLQVHTCGIVYGQMSAVIEHLHADAIPLPVVAMCADTRMRDVLYGIVGDTRQLEAAISKLDGALRYALGRDWASRETRPALAFLHRLDAQARQLLDLLVQHPDRPEAAEDTFGRLARRAALAVGRGLLDQVPASAYTAGPDEDGVSRAERIVRAEFLFYRRVNDVVPPIDQDES